MEVKSEKREQFVGKDISMNTQSYYWETVTPKRTPNSMEYSKFYRNNSKRKLEIGMSLVRVTVWINRFLANITKPQSDRESGELNPRELKQAEEQTIKRAQQECFPDEIRALEDDKPLPSKRTLLKITSCMGTSSIQHTTAIFRRVVRRDELSSNPSKELNRNQVDREVSP